MTSARKKAYLSLVLVALIFGSLPVLAKLSFNYITPEQLMFLRFMFVLPLSLFISKKDPTPTLDSLFKMSVIGIFTVISNLIYYYAIKHTTVIEGSLINNTSPIIITLASIIILKEKEERNEWFGLMLAIAGSTLTIVLPMLNSFKLDVSANFFGNSLMLLKICSTVVEVMLYKKWIKSISTKQLLTITTTISVFSYGLISAYTQPLDFAVLQNPLILTTVLFFAILGTFIAYQLQYFGYKYIEASEATLFSYLHPVVYIPLSMAIFSEKVMLGQIIGLLLAVTGVVVAEHRSKST